MLNTIKILGIRINNMSLEEPVNLIEELSMKKVFSPPRRDQTRSVLDATVGIGMALALRR